MESENYMLLFFLVVFCWVEGGRYRIGWLVASGMLETAERFQSRGAEQEWTKWWRLAASESPL